MSFETDEPELNVGFKDANDFSLHLENLKIEFGFDSYMETVVWYMENESDLDIDELVKYLNRKIREQIEYEALQLNMLKEKDTTISLF